MRHRHRQKVVFQLRVSCSNWILGIVKYIAIVGPATISLHPPPLTTQETDRVRIFLSPVRRRLWPNLWTMVSLVLQQDGVSSFPALGCQDWWSEAMADGIGFLCLWIEDRTYRNVWFVFQAEEDSTEEEIYKSHYLYRRFSEQFQVVCLTDLPSACSLQCAYEVYSWSWPQLWNFVHLQELRSRRTAVSILRARQLS